MNAMKSHRVPARLCRDVALSPGIGPWPRDVVDLDELLEER